MLFRQKELIKKYSAFDKLAPDKKFDLNDYEDQITIKHKLWCVVEELGEAYYSHSEDHRLEELIDSIHFSLELMIYLDFSDDELINMFEDGKNVQTENLLLLFTLLSNAGNFLKNKPWKKTPMRTDIPEFKKWMTETFTLHLGYCISACGSIESFFNFYDRKSLVNKFRIRSEY